MNLAGFFHVTQRVVRQMLTQGGGHVVNITTTLVDHAQEGSPSALASLTKGGLDAVTRSLAIEYAARASASTRWRPASSRRRCTPRRDDAIAAMHPLGRMGEVERRRRRGAVPGAGDVRDRRDPARRRRPGRRPLKRTTTIPQQISRPLAEARKPRDSSREPIVRWDGGSWAKAPGGRLPGRRRCVTVPSLVREGGKAWLS